MITRSVTPLPPGLSFARYAKALVVAKGDVSAAAEYALASFRESPEVEAALRSMLTRSPVGAMSSDSGLGQFGISSDVLKLLTGLSVFDAARAKMRTVPFAVLVPRQLETGSAGGWVSPFGSAIPVVSFAFDQIQLPPALVGAITILSVELVRHPGAELTVRDLLVGGLARRTDELFLDPSAGPGEHNPGAITYGVSATSWTGSPTVDLAAMLDAIGTSGTALTWLIRPVDMARLALALGAAADLPRTMLGLPVLPAPHAPVGQLTLVDLAEIAFADGNLEISLSENATVEMESAPTHRSTPTGSPSAPVPTELVSLYQTNSVGLKVTRTLNWAVSSGAVAYTNMAGSPA